ncbi:S-layer homology domain-containing protein [Dysosmobacter sp.]|uniref:S-layer homology domain-containing protein n=1 Tax=Dysosmobacter sp. TaxID=2591382 RepID=UPI002A99FCCC|nr:S-layer homology domain-containing protein [Dysosmobacter sp.]MDY5509546.1 S-layer homology domain-containing protein [Dysosmobacter sp.]
MKKKRFLLPVLCLLIPLALMVSALAAGGDLSDPLASLSYLTGIFTDTVNKRVDEKLNASDQALLSGNLEAVSGSSTATWTETRLKEGDVLTGSTGTSVLVLAGGARVTFSGAVVDVTTGTAVTSGSALAVNHRYLVAENTTADFTVTSKTAVVDYQGPYAFRYSNATDYNAIAAALKTLNLFKGSFTGYGEGYDLEVAPTRLQALIMFIRVLGEEDAALAYTGPMPFTDVAAGSQSEKYVGYAYSKGYTNGYSATTFRPSQTVTAGQYMEFMLRALGYSSAANTDLSGTLDNAYANGVITSGELTALQSGTFLRADLVYVSYYALDATMAGTGITLRDTLMNKGTFTSAQVSAAAALVPGGRK